MKEKIQSEITSYIDRVEEIKEILKNNPTKQGTVPDTANGSENSKDNKYDVDDREKKRMMKYFEGIFHHKIYFCWRYYC